MKSRSIRGFLIYNQMNIIAQNKFLAPYLPYGLKFKTHNVEIKEMERIYNLQLSLIKPILKPISDLSLLVIEEFEKYDGKRNGKANEEIIHLFCEENGVDEIIENIELKSLPYECIEFMFKNHYDFFGLIPKGLAVSVHDV